MTTNSAPLVEKAESTFTLQYAVSASIAAPTSVIWQLLTNATDFPTWNSTVQKIEGNIVLGNTLRLKTPLAPGRTFTLKVSTLLPQQKMVWQDGFYPFFRGTRTFNLHEQADGSTLFTMSETFTGIMLPLIKGSLPDFRESFAQYAIDLKNAAE